MYRRFYDKHFIISEQHRVNTRANLASFAINRCEKRKQLNNGFLGKLRAEKPDPGYSARDIVWKFYLLLRVRVLRHGFKYSLMKKVQCSLVIKLL